MTAFGARVGNRDYQRSLWLLLSGLLVIGCVSLTKPSEVQTCASTGTCTDDPTKVPGTDAKKDVVSGPADAGRDEASDTKSGVETVPPGPDASPDLGSPELGKDSVPADAADSSLPETPVQPDLAPDKTPGAEPSGAEPAIGHESVPEPAGGPEPGPEPAPEPGPEPGPEPQHDAAVADTATGAACANATPVTGGSAVANTTSAFCFVTCDSMEWGWGCSSFNETDRPIKVNGVSVTCGGQLPAKKSGYYYFEVSAGGHTWDQIHYSGTAATSCPTPAGGFSP